MQMEHADDPLLSVVQLSHHYGRDPRYVLAGGGNTSLKTDDRLWVKASGHALGTIERDGFVELERAALAVMLDRDWPHERHAREAAFKDAVMAARVEPQRGQRPSVEALLHHLMPGRFVVHTHPTAVNGLTCCTEGRHLSSPVLPEAIWQPYVDPGLVLAKALRERLVDDDPHGVTTVLLENHGLIVSGDDIDQIELTSTEVLARCDAEFNKRHRVTTPKHEDGERDAARFLLHQALAEESRDDTVVRPIDSPAMAWLLSTADGRAAALGGPLTPDQIVYCQSDPLWIDEPAIDRNEGAAQWRGAVDAYRHRHGRDPWVVLLPGLGGLAIRESSKLAATTAALYADAAEMMQRAQALGGIQPLLEGHRRFIEEWEVESYRRQVAARS